MNILKSIYIKLISSFLVISFISVFVLNDYAYARLYISDNASRSEILDIPLEYGKVLHRYGKGHGQVVLIQDLHANFEVQKNISEILSHIESEYGIERIGVEGSSEKLDLSLISSIPQQSVKKEVLEYFMQKGMLTGPEEFASLNNSIELHGLETKELFDLDTSLLISSLDNRNFFIESLERMKYVLKTIEDQVCSDALKELRTQYFLYRQSKISSYAFHKKIKAFAKISALSIYDVSPEYSRFIDLNEKYQRLDYKKIDKEYKKLISILNISSKVKDLDNFKNIMKWSESSLSKILSRAYSDNNFSHLRQYLECLDISASLNTFTVLKEEDKLINVLALSLANTKLEKDFLFVSDYMQSLTKFLLNQISHDELETFYVSADTFYEHFNSLISEYSSELDTVDGLLITLKPYIEEMKQFYEVALKRDEAFIQNFMSGQNSDLLGNHVMVVGGFHSYGVAKLLKEKSINHLIIKPHATEYTSAQRAIYYSMIRGKELLTYDEILNATLAPPSLIDKPWFQKRLILRTFSKYISYLEAQKGIKRESWAGKISIFFKDWIKGYRSFKTKSGETIEFSANYLGKQASSIVLELTLASEKQIVSINKSGNISVMEDFQPEQSDLAQESLKKVLPRAKRSWFRTNIKPIVSIGLGFILGGAVYYLAGAIAGGAVGLAAVTVMLMLTRSKSPTRLPKSQEVLAETPSDVLEEVSVADEVVAEQPVLTLKDLESVPEESINMIKYGRALYDWTSPKNAAFSIIHAGKKYVVKVPSSKLTVNAKISEKLLKFLKVNIPEGQVLNLDWLQIDKVSPIISELTDAKLNSYEMNRTENDPEKGRVPVYPTLKGAFTKELIYIQDFIEDTISGEQNANQEVVDRNEIKLNADVLKQFARMAVGDMALLEYDFTESGTTGNFLMHLTGKDIYKIDSDRAFIAYENINDVKSKLNTLISDFVEHDRFVYQIEGLLKESHFVSSSFKLNPSQKKIIKQEMISAFQEFASMSDEDIESLSSDLKQYAGEKLSMKSQETVGEYIYKFNSYLVTTRDTIRSRMEEIENSLNNVLDLQAKEVASQPVELVDLPSEETTKVVVKPTPKDFKAVYGKFADAVANFRTKTKIADGYNNLGWQLHQLNEHGGALRLLNYKSPLLKPAMSVKPAEKISYSANSETSNQELKKYIDLFNLFSKYNYDALRVLDKDIESVQNISLKMFDVYKELMPLDPDLKVFETELHNIGVSSDQLNKWINKIHQRLLKNFFSKESKYSTVISKLNEDYMSTVNVEDKEVQLINLEPEMDIKESAANLFLETIVSLPKDVRFQRDIKIISKGKEAWIYVSMGFHTCEIYVNLTNLTYNGMVRLNWFEDGKDYGNLARVKILSSALTKEGFKVEEVGTEDSDNYISLGGNMFMDKATGAIVKEKPESPANIALYASADKNTKIKSVKELSDKFRMLSRIVVGVKNLDTYFEQDSVNTLSEDVGLFNNLSAYFRSFGGLPSQIRYGKQININKFITDSFGSSLELAALLNEELDRLQLSKMDLSGKKYITQEDVDSGFNRPVLRALRAGSLILVNDELQVNPDCKVKTPLREFVDLLNPENSVFLRETASILDSIKDQLIFEEVGYIDGKVIKKTVLGILGRQYKFYCMEDASGSIVLAFAFEGQDIYSVGNTNNIIRDLTGLKKHLKAYHYDVKLKQYKKTKDFKDYSFRSISDVIAGAHVYGIGASPGRVIGPVTFDNDTASEDYNLSIFVSENLELDDIERLKASQGFIVASGNILSHPFIAARQAGKPGVILDKITVHRDKMTLKYQSYTTKLYSYKGKTVMHHNNRRTHEIEVYEGDLLIIDAQHRVVNVVGVSPEPNLDFREEAKAAYKYLNILNVDPNNTSARRSLIDLVNSSNKKGLVEFVINELFNEKYLKDQKEMKIQLLAQVFREFNATYETIINKYLQLLYNVKLAQFESDMQKLQKNIKNTKHADELIYKAGIIKDMVESFKTFSNIMNRYGDFDFNMKEVNDKYAKLINHVNKRHKKFQDKIIDEISAIDSLEALNIGDLMHLYNRAKLLDISSENNTFKQYELALQKLIRSRILEFYNNKSYVVNLKDIDLHLNGFVGNKSAKLGNLINFVDSMEDMDITVPSGFVLSTLGVEEVLNFNAEIIEKVEAVAVSDSQASVKQKEIRKIIEELKLPDSILTDIENQYHDLERTVHVGKNIDEIKRLISITGFSGDQQAIVKTALSNLDPEKLSGQTIGEIIAKMDLPQDLSEDLLEVYEREGGLFIAVRSSTLEEDSMENAAAGRFTSEVYIRGKTAVLSSLLNVTADYWGIMGEVNAYQPVLFQVMSEGASSAIVNSIDIANFNWNTIEVNSTWGAGAGLMSGDKEIAADSFIIDKKTGNIKDNIEPKLYKYSYSKNKGFGLVANSEENILAPSLKLAQLKQLKILAERMHNVYGYPLDIELLAEDDVNLIQARPIPGLFKEFELQAADIVGPLLQQKPELTEVLEQYKNESFNNFNGDMLQYKDNGGVLFLGEHGAGKSTLAIKILKNSDDWNCVSPGNSGVKFVDFAGGKVLLGKKMGSSNIIFSRVLGKYPAKMSQQDPVKVNWIVTLDDAFDGTNFLKDAEAAGVKIIDVRDLHEARDLEAIQSRLESEINLYKESQNVSEIQIEDDLEVASIAGNIFKALDVISNYKEGHPDYNKDLSWYFKLPYKRSFFFKMRDGVVVQSLKGGAILVWQDGKKILDLPSAIDIERGRKPYVSEEHIKVFEAIVAGQSEYKLQFNYGIFTQFNAVADADFNIKSVDKSDPYETSALHAGTIADMVQLLSRALPFAQMVKTIGIANMQMSDAENLLLALAEGSATSVETELSKLGLGINAVFNSLLNIYLSSREVKEEKAEFEEIKAMLESSFAQSGEKVAIKIYAGEELIESTDKFMLSPFIVKPDGTKEFHINKLLIEALYAEHGKKDLIDALVVRELTLQKYLSEGMSFDQAHEEILSDPIQMNLMEFAKYSINKTAFDDIENPELFIESILNKLLAFVEKAEFHNLSPELKSHMLRLQNETKYFEYLGTGLKLKKHEDGSIDLWFNSERILNMSISKGILEIDGQILNLISVNGKPSLVFNMNEHQALVVSENETGQLEFSNTGPSNDDLDAIYTEELEQYSDIHPEDMPYTISVIVGRIFKKLIALNPEKYLEEEDEEKYESTIGYLNSSKSQDIFTGYYKELSQVDANIMLRILKQTAKLASTDSKHEKYSPEIQRILALFKPERMYINQSRGLSFDTQNNGDIFVRLNGSNLLYVPSKISRKAGAQAGYDFDKLNYVAGENEIKFYDKDFGSLMLHLSRQDAMKLQYDGPTIKEFIEELKDKQNKYFAKYEEGTISDTEMRQLDYAQAMLEQLSPQLRPVRIGYSVALETAKNHVEIDQLKAEKLYSIFEKLSLIILEGKDFDSYKKSIQEQLLVMIPEVQYLGQLKQGFFFDKKSSGEVNVSYDGKIIFHKPSQQDIARGENAFINKDFVEVTSKALKLKVLFGLSTLNISETVESGLIIIEEGMSVEALFDTYLSEYNESLNMLRQQKAQYGTFNYDKLDRLFELEFRIKYIDSTVFKQKQLTKNALGFTKKERVSSFRAIGVQEAYMLFNMFNTLNSLVNVNPGQLPWTLEMELGSLVKHEEYFALAKGLDLNITADGSMEVLFNSSPILRIPGKAALEQGASAEFNTQYLGSSETGIYLYINMDEMLELRLDQEGKIAFQILKRSHGVSLILNTFRDLKEVPKNMFTTLASKSFMPLAARSAKLFKILQQYVVVLLFLIPSLMGFSNAFAQTSVLSDPALIENAYYFDETGVTLMGVNFSEGYIDGVLYMLDGVGSIELQELSGIKAKTARNIVRYIRQNGSIEYIKDLALIDGVGAETLKLLKLSVLPIEVEGLELMQSQAAKILQYVNSASFMQLDEFAGLRSDAARAIIDSRDENSAFKTIQELAKVEGVGKVTIELLKAASAFEVLEGKWDYNIPVDESVTGALHAGTMSDILQLMSKTLSINIDRVVSNLGINPELSAGFIDILKNSSVQDLPLLLKPFSLSVAQVYSAVSNVFTDSLRTEKKSQKQLYKTNQERITDITEILSSKLNMKKSNIEFLISTEDALLKDADRFLGVSLEIKNGKAVLIMHKKMLDALYGEHGKKDDLITALIEREVHIQKLAKQISLLENISIASASQKIFEKGLLKEELDDIPNHNRLVAFTMNVVNSALPGKLELADADTMVNPDASQSYFEKLDAAIAVGQKPVVVLMAGGGGGDILTTLAMAEKYREKGCKVVLTSFAQKFAGLAKPAKDKAASEKYLNQEDPLLKYNLKTDKFEYDEKAGYLRSPADFTNIKTISPNIFSLTKNSRIKGAGRVMSEANLIDIVAQEYETEILMLGEKQGKTAVDVAKDLNKYIGKTFGQAAPVFFHMVDCGGDIISRDVQRCSPVIEEYAMQILDYTSDIRPDAAITVSMSSPGADLESMPETMQLALDEQIRANIITRIALPTSNIEGRQIANEAMAAGVHSSANARFLKRDFDYEGLKSQLADIPEKINYFAWRGNLAVKQLKQRLELPEPYGTQTTFYEHTGNPAEDTFYFDYHKLRDWQFAQKFFGQTRDLNPSRSDITGISWADIRKAYETDYPSLEGDKPARETVASIDYETVSRKILEQVAPEAFIKQLDKLGELDIAQIIAEAGYTKSELMKRVVRLLGIIVFIERSTGLEIDQNSKNSLVKALLLNKEVQLPKENTYQTMISFISALPQSLGQIPELYSEDESMNKTIFAPGTGVKNKNFKVPAYEEHSGKPDYFSLHPETLKEIIGSERVRVNQLHQNWTGSGTSAIQINGSSWRKLSGLKSKKELAEYNHVFKLGSEIAKEGFVVRTGAGPGYMEAPMAGYVWHRTLDMLSKDKKTLSWADLTQGTRIMLAFEQETSPLVEFNTSSIYFKVFNNRKDSLLKNNGGIVCAPGGVGTYDELCEVLASGLPTVLYDYYDPSKGGVNYYAEFINHLLNMGLVTLKGGININGNAYTEYEAGKASFILTNSPQDTVEYVKMTQQDPKILSDVEIADLQKEFENGVDKLSDLGEAIVISGGLEKPSKQTASKLGLNSAYKEVSKLMTMLSKPRGELSGENIRIACRKNSLDKLSAANIRSEKLQKIFFTEDEYVDSASNVIATDAFNRKVLISENAKAYIFMPGDLETLNSVFDIAAKVLRQSDRYPRRPPVVLVGSAFWNPIIDYIRENGVTGRYLFKEDLDLFTVVDSAQEAQDIIDNAFAPVSTPEAITEELEFKEDIQSKDIAIRKAIKEGKIEELQIADIKTLNEGLHLGKRSSNIKNVNKLKAAIKKIKYKNIKLPFHFTEDENIIANLRKSVKNTNIVLVDLPMEFFAHVGSKHNVIYISKQVFEEISDSALATLLARKTLQLKVKTHLVDTLGADSGRRIYTERLIETRNFLNKTIGFVNMVASEEQLYKSSIWYRTLLNRLKKMLLTLIIPMIMLTSDTTIPQLYTDTFSPPLIEQLQFRPADFTASSDILMEEAPELYLDEPSTRTKDDIKKFISSRVNSEIEALILEKLDIDKMLKSAQKTEAFRSFLGWSSQKLDSAAVFNLINNFNPEKDFVKEFLNEDIYTFTEIGLDYYRYDSDGKLIVPGGLEFWKPILGKKVSSENFFTKIINNGSSQALDLLISIAYYQLGEDDFSAIAAISDQMFTSSELHKQEGDMYVLSLVKNWEGNIDALTESLPKIYESYKKNPMAGYLFDGISVNDSKTVLDYFQKVDSIDPESIECRDFQSSLYVLRNLIKNKIIDDSNSDRLLQGFFDAWDNTIDSWFENDLAKVLADKFTSLSVPLRSGIKTWQDASWQELIIRAVVGVNFQDNLYVSSEHEIDRINYILDHQNISRDSVGEFMLGLSYAQSFKYFPEDLYESVPNDFIKRHTMEQVDTWHDAAFVYEVFESVDSLKSEIPELPFIIGNVFALGAELGHYYHELILNNVGGLYPIAPKDTTYIKYINEFIAEKGQMEISDLAHWQNEELFDRMSIINALKSMPYLTYADGMNYVEMTCQLGEEAFKDAVFREQTKKSLDNISSSKRRRELKEILAKDSVSALIPSELYYLGQYYRENADYDSELKSRFKIVSDSLQALGVSPEFFQKEIDNVVGVDADVFLAKTGLHEVPYTRLIHHGEREIELHRSAERLTVDIVVWLSRISVRNDIPAQLHPYIMERIMRYLAPKFVQKNPDDWRAIINELNNIDDATIQNWLNELESEGKIKRGQSIKTKKRISVEKLYSERTDDYIIGSFLPFFLGYLRKRKDEEDEELSDSLMTRVGKTVSRLIAPFRKPFSYIFKPFINNQKISKEYVPEETSYVLDHVLLESELARELMSLSYYSLPFDTEYIQKSNSIPYEISGNKIMFYIENIKSEEEFKKLWWSAFKDWYYAELDKSAYKAPKMLKLIDSERPENSIAANSYFPIEQRDLDEFTEAIEIISKSRSERSAQEADLVNAYRKALDFEYEVEFEFPARKRILEKLYIDNSKGPEDAIYWQGSSYLLEILQTGKIKAMGIGRLRTDHVVEGIYAESERDLAAKWRLHDKEFMGYQKLFNPEKFQQAIQLSREEGHSLYMPGITDSSELSPLTIANKGPVGVVIGLKKKYLSDISHLNDGRLQGVNELPLDAIAEITFYSQKDYDVFLKLSSDYNTSIPESVKIYVENEGQRSLISGIDQIAPSTQQQDEYMMSMAIRAAEKAAEDRGFLDAKVGAAISIDNKLAGAGYNRKGNQLHAEYFAVIDTLRLLVQSSALTDPEKQGLYHKLGRSEEMSENFEGTNAYEEVFLRVNTLIKEVNMALGNPFKDAKLYITLAPCNKCTNMIMDLGIPVIKYAAESVNRSHKGHELLIAQGREVENSILTAQSKKLLRGYTWATKLLPGDLYGRFQDISRRRSQRIKDRRVDQIKTVLLANLSTASDPEFKLEELEIIAENLQNFRFIISKPERGPAVEIIARDLILRFSETEFKAIQKGDSLIVMDVVKKILEEINNNNEDLSVNIDQVYETETADPAISSRFTINGKFLQDSIASPGLFSKLYNSAMNSIFNRKDKITKSARELVLRDWAEYLSIDAIQVGKYEHYISVSKTLELPESQINALMGLYTENKDMAFKILDIINGYNKNKVSANEVNMELFVESLSMDSVDVLAMSLWFDLYANGIFDSVYSRKYVLKKLKGFDYYKVEKVIARVESYTSNYLGQKRDVRSPAGRGAIEVKDAIKPNKLGSRGIKQIIDIIKNFNNINRKFISMPAALAITAAEGQFDDLAAYALGEERSLSIFDIVMKQFEGFFANENSLTEDVRSMEFLMSAT